MKYISLVLTLLVSLPSFAKSSIRDLTEMLISEEITIKDFAKKIDTSVNGYKCFYTRGVDRYVTSSKFKKNSLPWNRSGVPMGYHDLRYAQDVVVNVKKQKTLVYGTYGGFESSWTIKYKKDGSLKEIIARSFDQEAEIAKDACKSL